MHSILCLALGPHGFSTPVLVPGRPQQLTRDRSVTSTAPALLANCTVCRGMSKQT